jgi:hypothetical protein
MIVLTWLGKIALYWTGFSVVVAIGVARVLHEPEDIEETLRQQIQQEMRAASWLN